MKLLNAALAFSLAALFAVLAWHWSETNEKLSLLLVLFAIITATAGSFCLWDWIADRQDEHRLSRAMAEAETPESRLADAISQLNTEQTMILSRQIVDGVAIINPDARPVFALRAPGADVPLEFAAEFLSLSNDGYLPAVRSWSEGSHEREWAQSLTDLLVVHHWAVPAIGNRSAALTVPLDKVALHLGIDG